MRGEHRLSPLQMGVARQDHALVLIAPLQECSLQLDQFAVDAIDGVADPKPKCRRDLVVATAGRVELAADIIESPDQGLLDVHVNVFVLDPILKPPLFDAGLNLPQGERQLLALHVVQDPNLRQHLRVSDIEHDVMRVEPLIKADALRKSLDTRIRPLLEYPAARRSRQRCLELVHWVRKEKISTTLSC